MRKPEGVAVCYVCDSAEVNDLELGEFHKSGKVAVHYFCLLLTSGLVQNGDEHQGLFGFLLKDIRAEVERIKRLKCAYCKKPKANIGCCLTKCRHTFHTNCGLTNGCLMQFEDPYKSYCNQHVRIGLELIAGRKRRRNEVQRHAATEMCAICYDQMGAFDMVQSVQSPCCKKSWFHKRCLQAFAANAGYFFKCPMCNNEDEFRNAVKLRGVFVPDRDAAWELEPNAFAELLERPETCEATDCVCPQGRDHESAKFKMLRCTLCGSHCVHSKCMPSSSDDAVFTCAACVVPASVLAASPTAAAARVTDPPATSPVADIDVDGDADNGDDDDDDEEIRPVGLTIAGLAIRAIGPDTDSEADTTDYESAEEGSGAAAGVRLSPLSVDLVRASGKAVTAAAVHQSTAAGDLNGSSFDVMFVETRKETINISSEDDDDNDVTVAPKRMSTSSPVRGKKPTLKRERRSTESNNNNNSCNSSVGGSHDVSGDFKPPQSKKIRRALQTMKNQSKITSFFSSLGAAKVQPAIPVVATRDDGPSSENVPSEQAAPTAVRIKSENR